MSETKKYFYLKLKDNFYNTDDIKLLESMNNGYEYSSLYLKLCLMALKEDGKLIYKGRIPYNTEMISTITGHNIDIVKSAIDVFVSLEMITILDSGVIFISDIQSLIGSSSSEAERKKKYRDRIKKETFPKIGMGHLSGQTGGHHPPEIELEIENRDIYTSPDGEAHEAQEVYKTKKGKLLSGRRLSSFMRFWDAFGKRQGKAEAADAWLAISPLTNAIVDQICAAAKIECKNRPELEARGMTAKMAQGWLSGRRWEDEALSGNNEQKPKTKKEILEKYGL